MSAKTELYAITRELQKYIKSHARAGAAGSVPATAEQRAAFEALKKHRENRKLEATRRELMQEETPERTPEQAPKPQTRAESRPATSESKSAKAESKSDNPAEDLRSRFNAAAKEKPAEKVESDESDDQPWKRLGSRPRPRFAAKKEKPNMADEKASSGESKQQSGGDRGPQYNENAYPEASGMMAEGPVDAGGPSGNAPSPASEEPRKAEKPSKDDMSKAEKLEFLENYLGDCKRCGLCESRTNIVFGDGSAEARLVFVGEAPGYNEDKQGLPFVGDAGKLLNKMIEAMGLAREDVYICNVIKCRPPKNRDPRPDEIQECSPFLRKQLEVISPQVIVSLGKFASQFLLESEDAMGKMRGHWHEWEGVPVMPTYHPAYLLRQENQKAKTWSDLQMVMERLGL